MPLNKNEKLLLEAIKGMLHQDAKLGLAMHDRDTENENRRERGFEYLHEQIEDMFATKAAELVHAESVCQAFHKVHSYKYLDDWSFVPAMIKEMTATAVPAAERQKAAEFIPSIIEELRAEQRDWAEKDSGYNPALDEVRKVSKPEQPNDFKIHERPLNKRNVDKPEHGDGSPARTSMKQPPLPDDGHDAESNP